MGIPHPNLGPLYSNPQTPGKTFIGLYIETRKARPKYTFMIDKKITKQPLQIAMGNIHSNSFYLDVGS